MKEKRKAKWLFPLVDWKKYFHEVQLGVREARAHAQEVARKTDGYAATIEALKQAEEVLSMLSKYQPDRDSALNSCRVLLSAAKALSKLAARVKRESPLNSTHFLLAGLMLARTLPMILTQTEGGGTISLKNLPRTRTGRLTVGQFIDTILALG